MAGMTERAVPPTARERAAFDAATEGRPKDFLRACRELDTDPKQLLDAFDSQPWRWLFSFSLGDPVTDEVRHRPFQPAVRERLDTTREYIEAPWWRRLFGQYPALEQTNRHPYASSRQPGR
jgi:hypothetical protein